MALKTYVEANGREARIVDAEGKTRMTTIMFSTLDGKHLQYRNVLRVLNKALVDIGVYEEGMAFHALRRLAASYFEAEGRTDTQIGALLGHADGGRLARSTYLRTIDGTGDALPDNVIPMPRPRVKVANDLANDLANDHTRKQGDTAKSTTAANLHNVGQ